MSKLNGLSSVERRIFDLLVSHLPKVRPGHGPSYLGYQEVHDILGLTLHGPTPGISLQVQGLETLANLLRDAGVPALTGIVIDKTKGWPSSGYFRVHQRKPMDFQFWMDHTAAAKRFDWAHWIATDNGQVIITDAPSTEWVLQIRWSEGVSETVDLQGVDEQGVWISTSESWENSQLPRATVKYRVFAHRHIDGGKVMFKLDYFRDQQHDQLTLEYGRWGQTLIVLSEDGEGYAQWHDGSDKEFSTSALAVTVVERLAEMPAHRAVIKNSTTLTKFLDSLGCRLRIGWYWSAASEDKRRVIFTVWADQIKNGCYTLLPNEEVSWGRLPGAYELRRHLPLSQVPDTEVYGVICKAVDEHAATREREYFNEYELVRLSIEQRDGAWVALLDDMVDVEHLRAGRVVATHGDAFDDVDVPTGKAEPERRDAGGGNRILRDAMVRRYVLRRAQGKCEFCEAPGFLMASGEIYLECHHIQGLADGGPDTIENVIALCANDHREAHYGAKGAELNAQMRLTIADRNRIV